MSSGSSSTGKIDASWKEWKNHNTKEYNSKTISQQSQMEEEPSRPKTPMPDDAMDFGGTSPQYQDHDEVDGGTTGSHVDVIINKMPVVPYGNSKSFGKQKLPRYFSGFVGPGWKPPLKKGVKKRPADILTNGDNMNVFKAIIVNMLSAQSYPAYNCTRDTPYNCARSKPKKQAIKKLKVTPNKPAIAVVNEILPNLEYVCKVDGPPHNPNFTVTVMYPVENGKEFVGCGRSKKIAKNTVAEKILQTLGVELPPVDMHVDKGDDTKAPFIMDPRTEINVNAGMFNANPYQQLFQAPVLDFSSDDVLGPDFDCNAEMSQPMIDFGRIRRLKNIQNFEENSCLALNALLSPQTINFVTLSEEGPPHSKIFTVQCTFQDKTFIGKGVSKRKAKACAAKQALISILGTKFYQSFAGGSVLFSNSIESVITPSQLSNERFDTSAEPNEYDLAFSDHVSKLVTSKFEELLKDNEAHMAQKVLAGVVMTTGSPLIETASVIAVTTGTKCIEGDFMSESGLALNDCHAEILATRCVRDFLYSQLDNFLTLNDENEFNIFEYDPNSQGEKTIILKEGVKFHLYISTSPCGDARIFSPKGTEASPADDMEDSHPNRVNRGVLRAKIEAGEGTIPVANLSSGPQTWDAIIQGNALHTMSCSDKVCRWNVIGFQGALLSSLISPVYYSSITLGSLHHPVHFRRAIIGRIEPLINEIAPPFAVNQPLLLMVTCEQKRKVKKSPNHAIAWSYGWSTYEHISASKGRCEPGGVASRLTKRMAFLRFLQLYKNQTGKRDNFVQLSYGDAKLLAEKYQITKRKFKEHMVESKFGQWISKPIEQDSFIITK